MKNLLTKGIVGCLITALLLWTTAPAIAHAAKEGDKKSTTVMYSLDEINDTVDDKLDVFKIHYIAPLFKIKSKRN